MFVTTPGLALVMPPLLLITGAIIVSSLKLDKLDSVCSEPRFLDSSATV